MSTPARRLGVIGGTFDPIHWGHLDAARAATTALGLTDLLFVPAHVPPHRPLRPRASAFHRFAMVALAMQEVPAASVSDIELGRPGPSYSIDTLAHLRAEGWQPSQICFIIGSDAFAEIATWRGYPALLDACHFAVISRAGAEIPLPTAAIAVRAVPAATWPDGAGATRVIPVPATTRAVSSTGVRERLAAGDSVEGLVPATVLGHITRHGLYRPGPNLAAR